MAVLITFMGYISISNIALYKMLKTIKCSSQNITAIISACLITETWGAGISFASKDHLIFVFLLPLCLLQYLITINKKPSNMVIIISIIMGGIAICLKPHYGIIPAAFFAHRLIVTKSLFKSIISYDFIGLLIIGISYFWFIYIFTPEYLEILPDIIKIYGANEPPFPLSKRFIYFIFLLFSVTLAFFIPINKDNIQIRNYIFVSVILCLLSCIAYILQFKGYNYHTLPFLSFALVSLFLGIFITAKEFFKFDNYAILSSCIIISLITYAFTVGGKYRYISSKQFLSTPFISAIDELAWNNLYANYNWNTTFTLLPYISDLKNGSRFGQIWVLNGLYIMYSETSNKQEKEQIMQRMIKHVDLIAEDMKRYKPSVITIPQYTNPNTHKPDKSYLNFLLKNKNFKENMKNYTFEKSIEFNNSLTVDNYDPEKIELQDIYVLKKDHKL